MTASASEQSTPESPQTDRLWAGKYKTAEEMENALLSQNKEVYKLLDEKKSLAQQVQQTAIVPENYVVPENLNHIGSEIDGLKLVAKNAGLSQTLFEKMVTELNTKKSVEAERIEMTKKALGDENITVLTDYVKKNYPEALHDTVLQKLIENPDARKQAMSDREKRLNSSTPGMSNAIPANAAAPNPYDGFQELQKLAEEVERNPSNSRLRDKLINLASEVGHARHGNK